MKKHTTKTVLDQRFPRRDCQPHRVGAPTYYLANFPRKLYENEKCLAERRASFPCAPIMSITALIGFSLNILLTARCLNGCLVKQFTENQRLLDQTLLEITLCCKKFVVRRPFIPKVLCHHSLLCFVRENFDWMTSHGLVRVRSHSDGGWLN